MGATTFRADDSVFETLTEISDSLRSVKGYNKTLIYLVNEYQPTQKKMLDMEKKIQELEKFKAHAIQVMNLEKQLTEQVAKLEKQLSESKKCLLNSMKQL